MPRYRRDDVPVADRGALAPLYDEAGDDFEEPEGEWSDPGTDDLEELSFDAIAPLMRLQAGSFLRAATGP